MDADPDASDLEDAIAAARQELLMKIGKRLPKVDKFFYGGHAHMGHLVAQWIKDKRPSDAEGAFGLGAFAGDSQSSLGDMPVPYLTLAAELDGGLARITRIA